MADCRYCTNIDNCQYIIQPDDCEDFEETFEHHWEMLDDIEREEWNDLSNVTVTIIEADTA